MPHSVNLYLVRHAVSSANLDKSLYRRLPDFNVPLDPTGYDQARTAGEILSNHFQEHAVDRIRILNSPYRRTRETADHLITGMKEWMDDPYNVWDRREELALREISFGLFDGYNDDELATEFPMEYEHYKKHKDFEGEFYAPMPLGESRAQVADRVKTVFGTILRDAQNGIRDFVIVSHGVTIRAFIMQWMHYSPEWYGEQSNPDNASIIKISSDGSSPYHVEELFKGFPKNI